MQEAAFSVAFLSWWALASYLGFLLFVPAASCSLARLSHGLIPAALLLGGILVAAVSRVLAPRRSTWLASGGCLVFLIATDNAFRWQQHNLAEAAAVREVVDPLRALDLAPGTRIYSLPYQHFCLTYYTGLPVQSIAPVRRSFLDRYPGQIVLLETVSRLPPVLPQSVQHLAAEAGEELSPQAARDWCEPLRRRVLLQDLALRVRAVEPGLDLVPPWVDAVADGLRQESEGSGRGTFDYTMDNPAMFPAHRWGSLVEFWTEFFYRFVGPEGRSGSNVNYAGRIREGRALLLPSTWIVFHCPARPADGD